MLTWDNPNQSSAPELTDDPIDWIASDTPTRIYVDGTRLTPASYGVAAGG
ncbi:hypothetical protein BH23ACT9_BH23ACT9_09730 [soil metagenome]